MSSEAASSSNESEREHAKAARKAEKAAQKAAEKAAKAERKAAEKAAKRAAKAEREAEKAAAENTAENTANETASETADAANNSTGAGKIEFESAMSRDEAIAYFSSIVDGLRAGTIAFLRGEDQLRFASLPDQLTVEVSASRKRDKSKIGFELSWRESARQRLSIVSDD